MMLSKILIQYQLKRQNDHYKILGDKMTHQNNSSLDHVEMRILINMNCQKNDYPDWVNEKIIQPREGEFIIWDLETRTVAKLWAKMALQFLAKMQADHSWQEKGIFIGEPTTWRYFDSELNIHKFENQIHLNGDRARKLFEFLEDHSKSLQEAAEKEEKEGDKALVAVFRLILKSRKERKTKQGGPDGSP